MCCVKFQKRKSEWWMHATTDGDHFSVIIAAITLWLTALVFSLEHATGINAYPVLKSVEPHQVVKIVFNIENVTHVHLNGPTSLWIPSHQILASDLSKTSHLDTTSIPRTGRQVEISILGVGLHSCAYVYINNIYASSTYTYVYIDILRVSSREDKSWSMDRQSAQLTTTANNPPAAARTC